MSAPVSPPPALGCHPRETKTEAGQEAVADIPTDTGSLRHGNDTSNGQEAPPGIERSIRPGVPCPETMLVAVMSDGSCLLVGYPHSEPAAFVVGEDAGPLRQALQAAFGYSTYEACSGNNSNGTALSGDGTTHTKKVQS